MIEAIIYGVFAQFIIKFFRPQKPVATSLIYQGVRGFILQTPSCHQNRFTNLDLEGSYHAKYQWC